MLHKTLGNNKEIMNKYIIEFYLLEPLQFN